MTPEVRVAWAVPAEPTAAAFDRLTPEERARAERLRAPAARARFVRGRVLAHDLRAAAVPAARTDGPGAPPHVSIAHTDGLVVVVLSLAGPVGVDVERRDRSPLPPARAWLSDAETDRLAGVPVAARHAQLVRSWTAKEAVAKALGTGLATPLAAIEVDGRSAHVPRAQPATWHLHGLRLRPGYVATLARPRP